MRNPPISAGILEFIRTNDENAIREFCASLHPAAVGERLGALSSREIWHVLTLLEPRLRAEIFGALDQEVQIQLAETVRRQDLAQIVNHMSADERGTFGFSPISPPGQNWGPGAPGSDRFRP